MQTSQTRQERRAAERKARKLARKSTQPFIASPVPSPSQGAPQGPVAGPRAKHGFSPELEDEFSPDVLSRARSIYYHFESKAAARRSASQKEREVPERSSSVLEISAKCGAIPEVIEPVAPSHKNKSTGPRTLAGKLASSGNSLKHGLAAPRLIIPGEDRTAFEALLADLLDEHQPASPTEELLVHEIAQSWWLTQRALRFQNECFTAEGVDEKRLSLFLRYQTTHERAFHKALSALIRLKKDRARGFVSQSSAKARLEPGFVSQNQAEASRLDQFVSQNAGIARTCDPFVLKNQASGNQFEGSAA
ncbi:MAG: hypothetical protein ACR2IV_14950 [Bryobacteraceae bacterium]